MATQNCSIPLAKKDKRRNFVVHFKNTLRHTSYSFKVTNVYLPPTIVKSIHFDSSMGIEWKAHFSTVFPLTN